MKRKREHQPSIKQQPDKTWRVDYRDSSGKRHRPGSFATKSEAVAFSKDLPDHPVADAVVPASRTVADYAPIYLKHVEGKAAYRTIKHLVDNHIVPFLGS